MKFLFALIALWAVFAFAVAAPNPSYLPHRYPGYYGGQNNYGPYGPPGYGGYPPYSGGYGPNYGPMWPF